MIDLVQTPESRAVLDRLTALMTLVEGHAEVVMDGVGPQVIPSVDAIRERFNRVWTSAETLPTLAELAEPDVWVRRVNP